MNNGAIKLNKMGNEAFDIHMKKMQHDEKFMSELLVEGRERLAERISKK
jgi:hypothetical protein